MTIFIFTNHTGIQIDIITFYESNNGPDLFLKKSVMWITVEKPLLDVTESDHRVLLKDEDLGQKTTV